MCPGSDSVEVGENAASGQYYSSDDYVTLSLKHPVTHLFAGRYYGTFEYAGDVPWALSI